MNTLHEWISWAKTLHTAEGISQLIGAGGWIALIGIIFAETGLLVGFFFPGDSLLITAGVFANPENPNHIATLEIVSLNFALILAAIVGNQTGYYLGKKAGNAMWNKPDGRFFKKKHLKTAHEFYEKHGGLAIVGARFVPIFRTFVPFAAGMARMPHRNFVFWDILGGVLWITSMLWIGYFLGATQLANRLDKLIVIVIFVSLLPMAFGAVKRLFTRLKLV